ncbi:MAG: hypothetical protein R3F56_23215 [Planctomycetota bacterium]
MIPTRLLALSLFATALAAQADPISPIGFGAAEASSSNPNPFGVTEPLARYLQIHEDLPAQPFTLQGLAWRRNADGESYRGYGMELDLRISIPLTTSAAPSATFTANHGRVVSQAVARRRVDFPASPPARTMPQGFDLRVPFDVPFVVSTGRVCWEVQIHDRDNAAAVHFDQVAPGNGNANPLPAVLTFGQGCVATGRSTPFQVGGGASFDWAAGTARMSFSADTGPANSVAIAVVGFDNQQWAGLPLPLPVPTSSGGPSGPCFVHNDVVLTLFGRTSAIGTFSTPSLTIELRPELHGATLFHHVWALDPQANGFGLVTTDGMGRQLIAPYATPAVSLVGVRGSLATTGSVNTGGGLVTRFVM